MASFINRLLSRIRSPKPRGKRNRRDRCRKLRVEQMEFRRLLAGNLGAIDGNVYTDLTDNGFDPHNPPAVIGDPGIAGVTLSLFQDDGNGTFGAEDGVAIATDVTDTNGDYRFDGLGPGRYFVQQAAATGKLQRTAETLKTVDIDDTMSTGITALNIDTFDDTPASLSAGQGASDSARIATAVGEALGGERDILVNNTTPPAGATQPLTVDVASGLLSISAPPGVEGNVIVSYDGLDADADTLDFTTLSPVDLTANNGEAFHFLIGSEAGNTLTVTVYSGDGTRFSSTTVPLTVTPNGGEASEDLIIPFTDINTNAPGGAVDFTNVTAIRFQVDVAAGADAQVNFTRIVAPDVTTQNFANLDPLSIGDLVFSDANNNGLFDGTDTGIQNVRVELFEDTNLNGVYDDGVDQPVAGATPQLTDANGNYLFDNLFPGEYIVLVPDSQFTAGNPLFGFLSSSGNDPAPDPDTVTTNNDDNGTLVVGGVATAAVTLASGAEPTNDGDNNNNSDLSVDLGFSPQVDLTVVKTADVTTVSAGNQITYTVVVSNAGDATATNVVVTDDLPDLSPDNLVIVGTPTTTGNGTVTLTGTNPGEIQVTYPSLTPGQSETITIVVQVPATAAAAAAITNNASVVSDGVETNTADNADDADVEIDRQAALTLTKTDSPDPSNVGDTLTYTILVTNTGPSTATNVVVSDTLPAGLTFVDVQTTAGTASEASGVITALVGTLAPNASATITVETTIDSTFAGSTIPNSATAQADEAPQVTANAETTVNPQVDLSITKTDDVDPVNRGDQLTYTLQIANAGPSGATNVEVVDTLPAGVTFVSATGGTVTPPSGGGSDVIVAVGNIASGGSATVTITVNVSQSAAASLTNNAIVRSTESTGGFDVDTTNNSTSETTATQAEIDLAITKSDSADPATPGSSLVYTIVVTNNGPSDATGVRVTDNLPDGIQITSATSTVGTVTIPASAQDTTPANNDDLIVNVGALANGATATITVNATVLPGTTGTLSNVATVDSTDTSLIESDTTNNTDTETTALTPSVDLRVTKADAADPIIAGNALTYTIMVTNDGPSTATNVNLSDTLPSGVTFTSATSTQGTVSHAAGVVSGNLGTLAPGATATVTLIVGVNPATRGTITNTASVTSTETDSNTTNNSGSADTTINGSVDVRITKADSVDPVAAGGSLTYTIIVTNDGPSTATSVVVSDTLPANVTFVSGTSTVGTVANASGVVTATVGTLAPGASATITLNTTVASTATTALSNTATVTSAETDTNTANNSATQSTQLAVPGSISGVVYIDVNRNGVSDSGDTPISGVTITLTGTDMLNNSVSRTTTTNANGEYTFDNLLPGTYQVAQTQPTGFQDGQTNVGTPASGATAGTNQISTINLASGVDAQAFNFGELRSGLTKRRFLASPENFA